MLISTFLEILKVSNCPIKFNSYAPNDDTTKPLPQDLCCQISRFTDYVSLFT